MARKLNKKQEKFIKYYVDNHNIRSADDIMSTDWEMIEEMNCYETLWQDVNRFVHDYRMSKIN